MNKILIVGHPQSGYQDVEALLHACGMARAQPSRREGFLPEQISDTICKAHGAAPVQELGEGREVQQIQAGPVWHGMALDLMLGNLDQPLWGWADPQALYLLDYWRDLDPTIHFILVYDRPHSAITRASAEEAAGLTPETLDSRTNAWATYNAALLHFFHRNTGRCLLVQSRQVRASASRYLQQVRARIDAPWAETLERLAGPEAATEVARNALVSDQTAAAALPPLLTEDPPLALFIANALTQQQPESLALYEELQASANLPLADESESIETSTAALEAWHAMVAQQQQIDEKHCRLEEQARQIDTERANNVRALARIEDEATRAAQAKEESDLLLAQLHQAQEELERHYLSGQEQAKRLANLRGEQQLTQQQREQADQLAQQRQQQLDEMRRRLTEAERDAAARAVSLQTELAAVKAQVAAAQSTAAQKDQLAQQRQQQLEGMRRQLTEAELAAAKAKVAAQAPAAPAAADPALAEENELLITQLHKVQEELERYYLENRTLKADITRPQSTPEQAKPTPATPALYGAADRVRQQLTYRVGATLLQRSRTLSGWVGMPWAVMGVIRLYRHERTTQRAQKKLPPIHTYRDAHEAERMRNHLSYRLGSAFLKNARSPIGWVRMPFALQREVSDFRKRSGA